MTHNFQFFINQKKALKMCCTFSLSGKLDFSWSTVGMYNHQLSRNISCFSIMIVCRFLYRKNCSNNSTIFHETSFYCRQVNIFWSAICTRALPPKRSFYSVLLSAGFKLRRLVATTLLRQRRGEQRESPTILSSNSWYDLPVAQNIWSSIDVF